MEGRMKIVLLCACAAILLACISVYAAGGRQAAAGADESVAYRREMAGLIGKIKEYGVSRRGSEFFVIANGGAGLMEPNELLPEADYGSLLQGLDGVMAESVNFGWDMEMDKAMPPEEQDNYHRLLDNARRAGVVPLVLDYAREPGNVQRAYREDRSLGYLGWVSGRRELDRLPEGLPHSDNDLPCPELKKARNYLELLNPDAFASREAYVQALAASNYDLLIVDAYYGDSPLTRQEVALLQHKPSGARRLVAAYMSVGEAEEYRPYWQEDWKENPPAWLWQRNEAWEGNFRVRYWQKDWQDMLMGGPDSYLDIILAGGFDGVFLDVVDVFYSFESLSNGE